MLTDTHCHLTCDELYDKYEELIKNAKNEEVDLMMIMATNKEEYQRALEIKEKYPKMIKVAFGWFPGDAKEIKSENLEYLKQEAMAGHIDVLGEIGLDYYWDKSFKEEQKELFQKQIEIANLANLPIAIHMREASQDTLDILKKYAKTPIIFHCFSGSLEVMKEALKLNSFISFAGPITYKNNKQGPINVKSCPTERILSETDAPYLSPVPKRGKRNEPAYVSFTVDKIAEIKGIAKKDLARQIRHNFLSLWNKEN